MPNLHYLFPLPTGEGWERGRKLSEDLRCFVENPPSLRATSLIKGGKLYSRDCCWASMPNLLISVNVMLNVTKCKNKFQNA